jgi:hypothetical protein
MPMRVQTVSVRLMQKFTEFATGLAEVFRLKASGEDNAAAEAFSAFCERFGAYELEIERYYDHFVFVNTYHNQLKQTSGLMQ